MCVMCSAEVEVCVANTDEVEDAGMYNVSC